MIYLKKTLQYLFVLENGKRVLMLLILSAPAGIAMSFVNPTWALYDWLKDYSVGNTDFWHAWNLGAAGYTFWIALAVLFVLIIVSTAMVTTVVSRSLRVGAFKVNRVFDEFNESFFPSLYTILVYLVIFLIVKTINSLFLVLWQTLSSIALSATLSMLSMVITVFGLCIFASLMLMYLPLMTFNGLRPKDAFAVSLQKCGRELWRIVPSVAIPIAAVFLIGNLIGIFEIPLLSEIADSVLYSFLIAYLVTLAMVSYYEIEQIKREDYPREYFFRNKK